MAMTGGTEHEHISELLLRFAEGGLAGSAVADVRRHLESCDDCERELRAVEALVSARSERLTDLERARLHRAVRSEVPGTRELTLEKRAPKTVPDNQGLVSEGDGRGKPSPAASRGRSLGPLVGVAALMLLLFGGAAIVGTGMFGSGGSSQEAATTAGSAGEEPPAGDQAGGGGGAESGEDRSSTDGADTREKDELRATYGPLTAEALGPGSPPDPLFDRDPPTFDRSSLKALGRSGRPFTSFAAAYGGEDARRLARGFLDRLADRAGPARGEQVRDCGDRQRAIQGPSLPAYAARTEVSGRASVVLGFVTGRGAALDRYRIDVFPSPQSGGCGPPSITLSGRVEGG